MQPGITHPSSTEEEQFRLLADMIPQLVWIRRADGTTEYCNRNWFEYTGMHKKDLDTRKWLDCYHPEDQPNIEKILRGSRRTSPHHEIEIRLRNGQSGEYRWFLLRSLPLKDAQGHILKWFGTATDIDEKKRQKVASSSQSYDLQVVADAIPQLVWIAGSDGLTEYANQRWYTYTQTSPEEALERAWLDYYYPDDLPKLLALWQTSMLTNQPFEGEGRIREGSTGKYRWFLNRAIPVLDSYGRVIKWFGTCTDIHEKKRAEVDLRISENRWRKLYASNMIGVAISNMDGLITDANDFFLRLAGYTRQDLKEEKISWKKLLPPDQSRQDAPSDLADLWQTDQVADSERILYRKDGSLVWIRLGAAAPDSLGKSRMAFVIDISEIKALDQKKDEFIGLASHELKSPLANLKLISQFLARKLKKGDAQEAQQYLVQITDQIDNCTRLVNDLLDSSKMQTGKLTYEDRSFDLDALLSKVVSTMQRRSSSHQLSLEGRVDKMLLGDPDKIGLVFTHLIDNAIKYSPLANRVDISVEAVPGMVSVRIQDYGLGIPKDQQQRIFERFYRIASKKESGVAGLGLGLYLALTIVKHYGGEIRLESQPGQGSTFTVLLPLQETQT